MQFGDTQSATLRYAARTFNRTLLDRDAIGRIRVHFALKFFKAARAAELSGRCANASHRTAFYLERGLQLSFEGFVEDGRQEDVE